ncbi:hypothetical protein D9611_014354 [Ephemerocybe angulata]|uniref:Uncharacterized protein n=1 Tax=Ephemerocybe angulata TaxID=980116 RepID=A0A8H5B9F7_9AGAR|nr:hypothetical protein D9611_014354 [Tulosesus angulatus]
MSEPSSAQSYSEEGNIVPRLASVAVLVQRGLLIALSLVCVAVEMGLFPLDVCPGHILAADASSSSLNQSYGDTSYDDAVGDEVSGKSDDENDVDHRRVKRQRLSTGDASDPADWDVFSLEDFLDIYHQFPPYYVLWPRRASDGDDSEDELDALDQSPKYILTSNVKWSAGAGYASDTESDSDSDEEVEVGLVDYTLRTPVNWAALEEGSEGEYDQLLDEGDDKESAASLAETEDNEDDTEAASKPTGIAALYAVLRDLPLNSLGTSQLIDEDEDDDTEKAREPIAALYAVLRELPLTRFGTTQLVDEDEEEESAAYLAEPEDNEDDTEDASEPTGVAALYALRELPLNRWDTTF